MKSVSEGLKEDVKRLWPILLKKISESSEKDINERSILKTMLTTQTETLGRLINQEPEADHEAPPPSGAAVADHEADAEPPPSGAAAETATPRAARAAAPMANPLPIAAVVLPSSSS